MAKPIVGNGVSQFAGIEDAVVNRLKGSALRDKAIGLGSGIDGTAAGKLAAVYVDVDLTGLSDLGNVDVGHTLGRVPTFCELVEVTNSDGTTRGVQVNPVSKGQWTKTNARVAVVMLSGAQAGTVLKFRVGGE